jgi:hypothetical protein
MAFGEAFVPPLRPAVQRQAVPPHSDVAAAAAGPVGRHLVIPLIIGRLLIGYVIWGLIAWGSGQTPTLQILGMRCYRP